MPVANLAAARFECVYPACGGLCCMNGRPAVEESEEQRIRAILPTVAGRMRPDARAWVSSRGFLSESVRTEGRPTLAVSRGWCVFFHDGCVLQKAGAEEGDPIRYKPWRCTLFPLARRRETGEWFVRQRGLHGERWDLFCLDPGESGKSAAATLTAEVDRLARLVAERRIPPAPPGREGSAKGRAGPP